MLNSIVLGSCLVLAAVLAAGGVRFARGGRWLRRIGAGIALLLALACLGAGALMVRGLSLLYARDAEIPVLQVARTPMRIARGEEIAKTFCGACHSPSGEMTGGLDIGKHLPAPIGSLVAPNLTPAGPLAQWSDGEIYRAIRNGVDAEGRWLIIMSYTNAGRLADEDVQSVIAYLRSLDPAGLPTQVPADQLNPIGAVMLGAGLMPRGHPVSEGSIPAPVRGRSAAWGQYLLSYQDCNACHGADLHGGVQGQMAPVGPDLSLVSAWSLQDFIKTMRTGIDPDNHQIQEPMPWRTIGKMDDQDLEALFQALTNLPLRGLQTAP
jgi:mono/diheme cytochrome c family protein